MSLSTSTKASVPKSAVPTSRRGGAVLIAVLGLSAMVVSMAQTQVVPILTLLAHNLHASSSGVGWVTTATLLSAAVFTPLLGRVGDLYGKKITMIAVLGVMVAGSLLAAITTSLALLIIARVLQGSATAIFPLALSIIRDQVPAENLPGAMALVSSTLAFGSGLSLVVTGLLTQGSDPNYHAVFWVSAGLAGVALLAAAVLVPDHGTRAGGRLDYPGTLTLAGSLVLLLLAISQGHDWGWVSAKTLLCLAGAILVAALWVLVERKVTFPLVDLAMFTTRQVALTNIAGLLVGFAMFAQFIGISYLVQIPDQLAGYGFTASVLRASVEYLLPGSLIALIAAPVGGFMVRRTGAAATLTFGALIGTAGFAWLAFAHHSSPDVILAGLLTGTAIAFGYAAMPALIAASVPVHQTGIANGINSISRSVGSSIASAVVVSLLASKPISHLPPGVPPLPQQSQFTIAFVIGMAALLITVPLAQLGLRSSRGTKTGV